MKLYKYCPLGRGADKDNKRLNSLRNNKIWLSTFGDLNDPFEAHALYLDVSTVSRVTGAPKERIDLLQQWCIDHLAEKYIIYSLSENHFDSMPMWAHYANNHQGFCVEYEVSLDADESEALFSIGKVTYSGSRKSLVPFMRKLLPMYEKMGPDGELPEDFDSLKDEFDRLTDENYFTKHISWAYEREWRLLYTAVEHGEYPDGDPEQIDANLIEIESKIRQLQLDKGKLVDVSVVGMSVSQICVGLNCSDENAALLNQISQSLGRGNAYRVQGRDNTDSYTLEITRM